MKLPLTAPLRQQTEPFDDPDWIYEIKHAGFRALAVIEHGTCRFVSRHKATLGIPDAWGGVSSGGEGQDRHLGRRISRG